ncbi:YgaP family membrane protein [Ancylobacter amanitiformis]|uniref:Inner membrane protein YgaP-like transmembrane domain-containing protein n=1 Tax=Ancylobacter amanitiformis TaxID=217069 RepID=A0ABU0LMC7_9HYPH|nr:DUF2892 domain-containing protein [Ancylobacter amanitiformis]MDQ0509857.1 hypothetical protein [Ancylobacter amanitiformis]
MNHNIGRTDRALRVVVGLALLSLLVVVEGDLRWLGLIGLVPLLTALVGNCPLYSILGVSSCPRGAGKLDRRS